LALRSSARSWSKVERSAGVKPVALVASARSDGVEVRARSRRPGASSSSAQSVPAKNRASKVEALASTSASARTAYSSAVDTSQAVSASADSETTLPYLVTGGTLTHFPEKANPAAMTQRRFDKPFDRVGVLGAGIMGTGIACHLANAGVEVVLLDIPPPTARAVATPSPSARSPTR
jgi:pyruvate/2-oxoglutarate dehydrogenase complex dihydrolipoamide dehydrogenase (E3) component